MSKLSHPLAEFFQHAYVTNDMARAKRQFADRWGVHSFLEFESALELGTPRGIESARMKIALAFVGNLQIELIEPVGGPAARIYQQALPASGYKVVWHHFAYRLPGGADAWQQFRSSIGTADYPIAIEGHIHNDYGDVRFAYLDTYAELGHYSEYVWASYDIDAPVPRN
ncbi:MAG TPA: VOC family protein [Steroidobacteraceae bacterium]|nr:VOC family protein [Steroidobacteraceae bacterium]